MSRHTAEEWMSIALDLAREAASQDEIPVGAVLVGPDETILGVAANAREESRRTAAHAEILALEDYSRRFGEWRVPPGSRLYVTVEPCLMCTGALLWARVSEVYYGCRDTKDAGLERVRALIEEGVYDHKFTVVQGAVMGEACAEEISSYFRAKRAARRDAKTDDSSPLLAATRANRDRNLAG